MVEEFITHVARPWEALLPEICESESEMLFGMPCFPVCNTYLGEEMLTPRVARLIYHRYSHRKPFLIISLLIYIGRLLEPCRNGPMR